MAIKNQLGVSDTFTLVSPDDVNELPVPTSEILGIVALGAGDIVFGFKGVDVTMAVAASQIVQVAPTLIKATLTTATNIHILS